MMERVYICVLAVMLCLGCSDDSFKGTPDGIYGDDTKSIPVVVALGDPSGGIAKGGGAVDSMEEWAGRHIFVYAFNKSAHMPYLSYSRANLTSCLVDGSRENEYSNAGKKARIEKGSVYAVWENADSELLYPQGKEQSPSYDFFAYYIDDAQVQDRQIERCEDSVKMEIEIDGSQDIMSSKAALTNAQLESFPEKERLYVKENAFGLYTARRNVTPTFHFNHHLARLEFELVYGVVREEEKTVYIHSLTVKSKCKASFIVAHKDASRMGMEFHDVRKELVLKEEGGVQLKEYIVVTRPSPEVITENVKMGDCLLVAPDTEYDAYMVMTEKRADGTTVIDRVRTPLTISYGGGQFEAGNQYKVKLTVYGATQVSASVELEPWRHGGSIEMDEEKDKPII